MCSIIYARSFESPSLDRREIKRYAGIVSDSELYDDIIDECIEEIEQGLVYKVAFREYQIAISNDVVDLGFEKVKSKDLSKALRGCSSVIVFAATVGINIDRLIARYAITSKTKSLILQAVGTERVEALCDEFCKKILEEKSQIGLLTTTRFSPGYGDLPLEMQKSIFRALGCSSRLGISLTDSLLMTPSKSVTAFVGIKKKEQK